MGWNFLASLLNYLNVCSLVFVAVNGSSHDILSVTRSRDKGDSFEVDLESNGCPSCEQYGAVSGQANGGASSKCYCQCDNRTKPTFYSTHSGQRGCVKDRDVLADTQGGDICDFYTGSAQQLQVLDLHAQGKARLKPDGFCEQVQITGWKFYFNTSWVFSTSATFYAISSNKGNKKLPTFLFWKNNLDSFYKGLLIKIMIRCTYRGKTDDRCLMLKAQGTHQYFENVPTTTPPVHEPVSSTSLPAEKDKNVQKSTKALVESTEFKPVPTGEYSEARDKQIWIAVSLGLSGLVLIIIVVIAVFLVLKCRRNCKQEGTESHHHPAEQPSLSAVCSPLHDYEYVHYPCLVEGGRTPPRGNPLYERSEDNKLIIWTPGHSGTLTRPNSQSAEATAPRLPYQRLLTRTSSSSPDCSAAIGPLSPSGTEEGFPYQKLVKSVPSLQRDDQGCGHAKESTAVSSTGVEEGFPYQKLFKAVPSLQREKQACCPMEESESTTGLAEEGTSSAEAYQSLSLQRNPLYSLKECEGYAEVNSASRPESSSEYDYARVSVELDPVELKKLFRTSHSETEEMPRTSMEISIGDLDNTTSNTNIDQKRHSGIRKTSSTSSCSGDYENCTCTSITKRESQSSTNRDNECVNPNDLRPAVSYEDLSGGCRLDPEEYVEMGKRRSTMIAESCDPTDTEDGGHEYFVLEGLVESCEGETVEES